MNVVISDVPTEKNAMRVSAANPLGRQVQSIIAHHLMQKMDIFSQKRC